MEALKYIESVKLRSPWWLFVMVSMTLHIILLAAWDSDNEPQLGSDHNSPIAVTLVVNSVSGSPDSYIKDQTHKEENHLPAKKIQVTEVKKSVLELRNKEKFLPTANTQARQENYEQTRIEEEEIIASDSNTLVERNKLIADNQSKKLIEQFLLSQIRVEFSRHFKYPSRALRKSIEGEVILSFRLDANGLISNITIAESSGYGILDRAAIRSLNKVEPLNDVPSSGFGFTLPVIYKIKEG